MPDPVAAKTRPLRLFLALAGVVAVAVLAALWLARRQLARDALTDWLKARGVPAQAHVEAIGPTSFVGSLTLGDPAHPDFTAERVAVRYRITATGLLVRSATLTRPVLRARLHDGHFSVGKLDPLVSAFLSRPPPPGEPGPRVQVDAGRLILTTDYGQAEATANLLVADRRLVSLSAVTAPARLSSKDFDLSLGRGRLAIASQGQRLLASLDLPLVKARAGTAEIEDAQLGLKASAPYPDTDKRRTGGPVALTAQLAARDLRAARGAFARTSLSATFDGRATGWVDDLALDGSGSLDLTAEDGAVGGARIGATHARLDATDAHWRRGGAKSAEVKITASAQDIASGALRVATLKGALAGGLWSAADGPHAELKGDVGGRGRWVGRRPVAFSLAAPSIALAAGPSGLALKAGPTVRLATADRAGEARLDGLALKVAGGTTTASARLHAEGSVGLLHAGAIDGGGVLRLAKGRGTFTAVHCVSLKAARLDFGANDVDGVAARLCPVRGPLARFAGAAWSVGGRIEEAAAAVPFAQVRMTGGAGPITLSGRGAAFALKATLAQARVEDTAAQTRFNPVELSGPLTLDGRLWRADLAVREPGGPQLGDVRVTHDGGLGVGVAEVRTGELDFADGALQPQQLSPLAALLGAPVTGSVAFDGRYGWGPTGAGSEGTLTVVNLGFQSPAGRVEGLKGELKFSSLAPPTLAGDQELDIARVDAIVPVTDVKAKVGLADNLVRITGGEAHAGGGLIRVDSLELPLGTDAPVRGVLTFDGVQLHDLVEATPFGDKVDLDARVSGKVPFESRAGKVTITGGQLHAIQPGRLSIDRTALSGVQAQGALPSEVAAPNSTFTDFAYQAMEDLAFDRLDASMDTHPDGRLGVLFHINGRHDPPKHQEIRIGLLDLIQKKFLGRQLPLPSGTQVNLTLDTTLNLDDLLADYAEFQKLRGSAPVQPRSPTKETK